ncbi:MAG: leucyl aminopeptidase, partial [Xanthomonadales bacterium]|nr:leucyl aminopeptidase [Xanthomonadales bacterium]
MALELSLNRTHPAEIDSDCLIVGLFADHQLEGSAAELDQRGEGRLKALIESEDVSGKAGKTALLHGLPGVAAKRVLLVGLGERERFDAGAFQKAADAAF